MLHNAFLHLLHSVVVFVQHLLRIRQIQVILGRFTPRQFQHGLCPCVFRLIVGRMIAHVRHLVQRVVEHLGRCLGPLLLLALFAHLIDFILTFLAQLLLDSLHLLPEEVLLVLLVQFLTRAHLQIHLQRHILVFPLKDAQQGVGTVIEAVLLQQHDALLVRDVQVGADEVYGKSTIGDVVQREG